MARSKETKIELTAYDDLFETDQSREEAKLSKIRDIPISEIDEFPDHPFKVFIDEDMEQLVDSIKRNGVSVTEGDFLRHLLVCQTTDLKVQEGYRLGSIVRRDFFPALQIDADSEQVVTSMLNQNFVPIVDGRNALCGILTRKRLIEFLAQARDKKE